MSMIVFQMKGIIKYIFIIKIADVYNIITN